MAEQHADFSPFLYLRAEPEDWPAGGVDYSVTPKIMEQQTSTPRIAVPFPVIVRTRDSAGARFEAHGVLDHLSARDLCVRVDGSIPINGNLLIVIRFSLNSALPTLAPGVAVQGIVQRAERLPDGRWGMAITIGRHYFLYTGTER